ncbi:hypothetical protein DFJ73DRAFT_184312 [Zopfochytrium polystomum]|nr:hypothetical protein DFJ73DRAFT_184312 [Zopfochytrium polystomum]
MVHLLLECVFPHKLFFYVKSTPPRSPRKPVMTSLLSLGAKPIQRPQIQFPCGCPGSTLSHVRTAAVMESAPGSVTPESALTAGLQLLPLGITNPSMRTALACSTCCRPTTGTPSTTQKSPSTTTSRLRSRLGLCARFVSRRDQAVWAASRLRRPNCAAGVRSRSRRRCVQQQHELFWVVEPGFYINRSMSRNAEPSEFRRFLADKDDCLQLYRPRPGQQPDRGDVAPRPRRPARRHPAGRQHPLGRSCTSPRFTPLGVNGYLSEPILFFTELLNLMAP